jgi:hypothetical protein
MGDSDIETGLEYQPADDWTADVIRGQAEALTPLDLGARAVSSAEPEFDFDGFGARFTAPDTDLQLSADDARLADDLAKFKEQAADAKLRALLDKAERELKARRFAKAWTHAAAALKIAPASVPALLIGARCKYGLSGYEAALDLLVTARRQAKTANETTAVLRLRTRCELGLINQVSTQARTMVDGKRNSAAVQFVRRKVAKHPDIVELRFILGGVLYRADELAEARDVIEALLATAQGAAIESIVELHQAILAKQCAPKVERARRSLRTESPEAAIRHLSACGASLHSVPRYERVWSYAHQRSGWRRARRAKVTRLDADGLQDVLMWLLSDEFGAAMKAFLESDFERAGRHCASAAAIDARCGAVAYLHALAEIGAAKAVLKQIDLTTLASAERRLTVAAGLLPTVCRDPALIDHAATLAARTRADRTEVRRLTNLVKCVSRFNELTDRYAHSYRISAAERRGVRAELRSIRFTAKACKRQFESDSPVQQRIDELIGAIDGAL